MNVQLHLGDVPQPGPGDGPGLGVVVLCRPQRHPPRPLLRGRVLHQRPGPRAAAQPRPRLAVTVVGEGERDGLEPGDGGGPGGVGGLDPLVAGAAGLQPGQVVQEGVAQLEVQQVGVVPELLHLVQHREQRRLGLVGVHGGGSLHGGEHPASGVVAEDLHKVIIYDED